jgi:hypothetical protein
MSVRNFRFDTRHALDLGSNQTGEDVGFMAALPCPIEQAGAWAAGTLDAVALFARLKLEIDAGAREHFDGLLHSPLQVRRGDDTAAARDEMLGEPVKHELGDLPTRFAARVFGCELQDGIQDGGHEMHLMPR